MSGSWNAWILVFWSSLCHWDKESWGLSLCINLLSLHHFTSARLWLTAGESASVLCSELHVYTPRVVFWNMLKKPSSFIFLLPLTIEYFSLENCAQVEGTSPWFCVDSLICFKLNNFPSIRRALETASPHVVGSKARAKKECEEDTNTAQCLLSQKLHQGSDSSDLTFKQCQLRCSKSKLTCGGGSHILSLMSLQLLMLQRNPEGN